MLNRFKVARKETKCHKLHGIKLTNQRSCYPKLCTKLAVTVEQIPRPSRIGIRGELLAAVATSGTEYFTVKRITKKRISAVHPGLEEKILPEINSTT